MKHFLLLFFSVNIFLGSSAQLGNYDACGKVNILGQTTALTITTKTVQLGSNTEAAGAILGAIAGPVIDILTTIAKEKIKQNAAKYINTFTVSASGDGFWVDPINVNLPVLTLTRGVMLPGSQAIIPAMQIVLDPELSADSTAFRYKIHSPFTYVYSGARTRKEYDYIDIVLDIKFKAIVISKSQYEIKDIRATNIKIPMAKPSSSPIPASGNYVSGWIPLPAKPSLEVETDVTNQDSKTVTTTGTIGGKAVNDKTVIKSEISTRKAKDIQILSNNAGLYEIEITVTETNPYKIKAENIQKVVEATGDAPATLLKEVLKAATKKEEKATPPQK